VDLIHILAAVNFKTEWKGNTMLVILAFLGGAIIGALALAVVREDDNIEQLDHIDELD
jgi:uncharacterized membrane protein YoaK (UPF0700 family)